MARLIDADTLKEKFKIATQMAKFIGGDLAEVAQAINDLVDKAIDEAPTIEAEPVRRGETGSDASGRAFGWKTPVGASWRSAVFICEKCGGKVYWPQAMRGENSNKRRCYYPTCPWCGAKMEVEAGDQ